MENNKLNVCLINDSFPPLIDGVENTVVNYASNINWKLGKAVVATPYYPDTNDEQFDFPVVRFPSLDTTKLVGYRAGLTMDPGIMRRLEDENFDIIHSHCPIASTFLARTLRNSIDAPIVLTYHTKFDIDIRNSVKGGLIQDTAIKALVSNISACDEIWAVSKGAGENLKSLGFEGNYVVMPNGVDFKKGRISDEEVNKICKVLPLNSNIPCYLFVGRIMWYKGIRIILDALSMLSYKGKDFRMVFIGKGADKNEIIKYSESLGLGDKVLFLDPIYDRNELRAWYCRANLFLFPSTFDTNGLVVREAAACALGSVLIKGSCAAEDTIDGENCLWIDENADSLFTLLMNKGFDIPFLKTIGENAQNELYCSWEDSVKNAYERYGIVIDKYHSGDYALERKERQTALNMASDALFKLSSASLHNFAEMERNADNLSLRAWIELNKVKNDYELMQFRIDDFKDDIIEARNHFALKRSEKRNEFVFEMKDLHNSIRNELNDMVSDYKIKAKQISDNSSAKLSETVEKIQKRAEDIHSHFNL